MTLRSTRFPWDAAPVTQTIYGDWTLARDDCVAEPEPDFRGPDHGDPGGDGPGGTAGSSGDSCGGPPPGSPVGDVCSADGSVGPGAGNGGGDGGGCFLTTAVAEWRGESDNGPTLTALRAFRDGYMMRTPERRALVTEYYAIAPAISAAIPVGHADWKWIAARIDAAVAAIAEGAGDEAFCIYVAMVRRLQERWMPAAGPASLHDGGRA